MIIMLLPWILPVLSVVMTFIWGITLLPIERMFLAILPLIFSLKLLILIRLSPAVLKEYSKLGLLLYSLFWPGMNPAPFKLRSLDRSISKRRIFIGIVFFSIGSGVLFLLVTLSKILPEVLLGWGGVFALLLAIHLGFSEFLTQGFCFLGWRVSPLFLDPLLALSLREFWSKRWNLAFVEMNQLLFLPLVRNLFKERLAIFAVFFISALLHECAISFPVQEGWGGPLAYFILHGLLVILEKSTNMLANSSNLARRFWTFGWLLIPLPILFHVPFRHNIILPLINFLYEVLC